MAERGRHRQRPGSRSVQLIAVAAGHPPPADHQPAAATGANGPFDEHEAPPDDASRLDLGSLRLPIPADAQLQVEVEPTGQVRAVHVLTPDGQLTLTAFAAPRSNGLWPEVAAEIASQMRADGAQVGALAGEWGRELHAELAQTSIRFVGVDGPRWLLRGVAAGPPERFAALREQLYDMVRGAVVVRGEEAMPVGSPLPLSLPEQMAEQLQQLAAQRKLPESE